MGTKEGRPVGKVLKQKKPVRGGLHSRAKDTWLGRNWSTVLILVAIIVIALFVRSYFAYSTAVDNGFLVAGGSDSYYHQRVIDYVQDTGSHLVNDPLLNYPLGMRNPRPPLYDWSVAVTGQLMSGITGMDIGSATGYALLSSTAIWGALTCIPVFLITRAAFGNRAGLLAALLLALMPGHVQSTVFANADHDAMVLFFVVFAFYFLLRSLMSIHGTKWVGNWKSMASIREGIGGYLGTNQRSIIYALLGGVCVAAVAMIWTGFTYVLIIILVYLLVQVIINRFRNVDSLGELMIVGIMLASAFAIMAPLYWQMNYWNIWFDVPFYLFLGSMAIGAIFTVTRDYPWTLSIPIVVAIVAVALVGVYLISPGLFDSIVSGQGYLVKSRLYATIAEAQAPGFSSLALSFGPVTFWLAIIGFVWAAIKIPKNPSPYLTFVVVWMGVSMYMASSASRFMFNASPAFAMASGWILALLIGAIRFEEIPRALSGFRSNPLGSLRKAIKLRNVAGALFLAFLIVTPNVWTAMDAGMPSETKRGYDQQIYNAMPGFMRPADYDSINDFWYLGAFGYSLPLPSSYWPAAWSWFSQRDTDQDVTDRPAFLSWWDYGFEAIQAGQHPTVSDNFQNGYQFAGSFITAGGEDDAMALLIIRILEGTGITDEMAEVLNEKGVDAAKVKDIMSQPSKYIDVVKGNPDVYGPYDDELSAQNAMYAAARVELKEADMEGMVEIYSKVREISGKEIGYFAVDGRLFPFSADYNSIFYAPASLSDRTIDRYTNAPSDYYEIKAVTSSGQLKSIQELTYGDRVIYYTIVYKGAFYDTMLYRAIMGYSPSDVGKDSQGIPGISGSLKDMAPMPGWNLTHFKQVYRTAYYLPDGSDTWQAIPYEDALDKQERIDAGEMKGKVDLSASTLASGTVFLQYYDGAILRGKATTSDGTPYEGIYVTVLDELGIPHQCVETDENGDYELILPFGDDIKVVYSAGTLDKQTLTATELYSKSYSVTYPQAMREGDYIFDGNIELPGTMVSGNVYWDVNGDNVFDDGDEYMENATVVLENPTTGFRQEVATNATGWYKLIAPGDEGNYIYTILDDHSFGNSTIHVGLSGSIIKDIRVQPSSISGTVEMAGSTEPAPGLELSLTDEASGKSIEVTTGPDGSFKLEKLLPGAYILSPSDGNTTLEGRLKFNLLAGEEAVASDLVVYGASHVSGEVMIDGTAQEGVSVGFLSGQRSIWVKTDDAGIYNVTLPTGDYTIYAYTEGYGYVSMEALDAEEGILVHDLNMMSSTEVSGKVLDGVVGVKDATVIFTLTDSDASQSATTDADGKYVLFLPSDITTYSVYAASGKKAYWGEETIEGSLDLVLTDSAPLTGQVYRDINRNKAIDPDEPLTSALVTVKETDSDRKVTFVTGDSGKYSIALPKGMDYVVTASMNGYETSEGRTLDGFAGKVENIALIADNRTVTGTVLGPDDDPLSDVTIEFVDTGDGALDGEITTIAGGAFEIELSPGTYQVIIDMADVGSKQYYNGTLTVPVGRDPAALTITTQLKHRVEVTVVRDGEGTIRFIGPEDVKIDVGDGEVFLLPGEYTIYTLVKDGDTHLADLRAITVPVLDSLEIDPEQASSLSGEIFDEDGDLLKGTSEIIVKQGGAELSFTSSSDGTYQAYLPDGKYDLKVGQSVKREVDGKQRYVVYSASEPVDIAGTDLEIPVTAERNYDSVAVSGEIIGSSPSELYFTPLSETAMEPANPAVISGSSYSIDLAPGTYSVYGVSGGDVVLRIMTVEPGAENKIDLTMVAGHTITGKVTDDKGNPMPGAEITFSDITSHTITAEVDGEYSAVLPQGMYHIAVISTVEEGGVLITWAGSTNKRITGDASIDIELELHHIGVVELEWDDATIEEADAGDSVTYEVKVVNRGNIDDTYRLSSTSPWTVSFSENDLHIASGEERIVEVTIKTPSNAKVKHSLTVIVAKSLNNTGASGDVELDVTIRPNHSMKVTSGPAKVKGDKYVVPVMVENTGNAEDRYEFSISDDALEELLAQGWKVSIPGRSSMTKDVSIDAGKTATINLEISRLDDNAESELTLKYGVKSDENGDEDGIVKLDKLRLSSDGDVGVSGQGTQMSSPPVPIITWVMLAILALLGVAFVTMKVNKGVLGRRRKR